MKNNVTIKELVESLSNLGGLKNLSLHIKLFSSFSSSTEYLFGEIILPQDKAVLLFGDYKTIYIKTSIIEENVCIYCGIAVIEKEI